MDLDYVRAVMAGRGAEVGAPAPLLDEAAWARAARRLADLSPQGDVGEVLSKLGVNVGEAQLSPRAPMLTLRGKILVDVSATEPLRSLLVFGGLALTSLRFEAATPSSSDVWLVANKIGQIFVARA